MAGPYEGWSEEPAQPAPSGYDGWTEESPEQVSQEREAEDNDRFARFFFETDASSIDREAQVEQVARDLGVDAGMVGRNFDELQRTWSASKFDPVKWKRENPALADLLRERPDLGRIAVHDPTLKGIPSYVRAEDLPLTFGGAIASGTGLIVRGAGTAMDLLEQALPLAGTGQVRFSETVTDEPAASLGAIGKQVMALRSRGGQAAVARSQFTGDISDPSTWSLGEDPTFGGLLLNGLEVVGNMAPVIAASAVTGGAGAALIGGLQGGGGAVEQARDTVMAMDEAELLEESAVYSEFRAQGMGAEDARRATADEAAKWAFALTAPVSAVGGAATSKIMSPAAKALGGRVATRMAGHVLLGGAEEGTQELAEGVATQAGTAIGGDVEVNLLEDSFQNLVMGALGGGAPGIIGATKIGREALRERREDGWAGEGERIVTAMGGPTAKADPEAAAKLFQSKIVYLDPAPVLDLLAAHKTAPEEVLGPDAANRLQEARATGEKLAVPVAELAALAQHPAAPQIAKDHVTTRPEAQTRAERKANKERDAADTKALVDLFADEDAPPMEEGEAALVADMQAQLAKTRAVSAKQAADLVAPIRAFIRTMAKRAGISADELFKQRITVERGTAASEDAVAQSPLPFAELTQREQHLQGAAYHLDAMKRAQARGEESLAGHHLQMYERHRDAGEFTDIDIPQDARPQRVEGTVERMRAEMNAPAGSSGIENADPTARVPKFHQADRVFGLGTSIAQRFEAGVGKLLGRPSVDGPRVVLRSPGETVLVFQSKNDTPRGFMERRGNELRITLTPNADLSTFLHEAAHVQLELMRDLMQRDDLPPQVREDAEKMLAWLGVDSFDAIKREHHEKFARGMERYLRDGKAPSKGLQRAFERFAIWLTRIYRDVAMLDVDLSDEVRGVFDRMLATDDEIALARGGIDRQTTKPEHMTDAEFAAMNDALDRAEANERRAAVQRALELRQREQEKWWKEEEAKEREAAEVEYDGLNLTKAVRWVRFSEVDGVKVDPPVRLDREQVEAIIGKEAAKPLNHILKKGGDSVVTEAAGWGYNNPAEFLAAILTHPTKEQWAKQRAIEKMREKHGDLRKDRAEIAAAIKRARTASDADVDAMLIEYASIVKVAGGPKVSKEAAHAAAKAIVAKKRIGYVSSDSALNAERRANQRLREALARRDYAKAKESSQEALVSRFVAIEAAAAERMREKFEEIAASLANNRRRGEVGKAAPDLRDAIDSLLAHLGVRPDPDAQAFKGVGHLVAQLAEVGVPATFDEEVLQRALNSMPPASASRAPWENISVEGARELVTAVTQLRHAANELVDMHLQERRRSVQEVADAVATESSHLTDRGLEEQDPLTRTVARAVNERAVEAEAQYERPERIFERLGPTAHEIFRRFLGAQEKARSLFEEIGAAFTRAWESMPAEMQKRRYETIDASGLPVAHAVRRQNGPVTREWLWALVLNWGNPGNRQRLLDGYGWTEQQVHDFIARNITAEELTFLQSILDITDSLRPESERVYEAVHGVKPGRVQAQPDTFILADGSAATFKGGYYPARYDAKSRDRSRGILGIKAEEAGVQDARASAQASVSQSFTKTRAARFVGAISLDFGVVPAHLSQVIHYIAHEEQVREMNRLLANDTFRETVERRLGKPYLARLEEWNKSVAGTYDDTVAGGTLELLGELGFNKSNFVAASLGFNVRSFMGDILEIATPLFDGSIPRKHISKVLARLANPSNWTAMREEALRESPEVRKRTANLSSTLRKTAREIGKGGAQGRVARFSERNREMAFVIQEAVDAFTSTVIWHAARDAERDAASKREIPPDRLEQAMVGDANRYADDVLRKSKAPATVNEQSALLRDKKAIGALLTFFGWRNHMGQTWSRMIRERGFRGFAEGWALLALTNTLGSLLVGDGPEDDESWAEWTTRKSLSAPAMVIPLFGFVVEEPVNQAVSLAFGRKAKHRQLGLMTSGHAAGLERSWNLMTRALREDDYGKAVIVGASALAIPLGLPATQFQRTAGGIFDMVVGNVEVENALDAIDMAIYGSDPRRGLSPLGVASGRGADNPVVPK